MPLKIRPNAIEQEFGPFTFPGIRIEDPSDGSLIHNISRTEVVFNEGGGDIDLRVEGITNPNLLVINAGTNKIGIGTAPTQGDLLYLKSPGSALAETVLILENPNANAWANTVLNFLVLGTTKGSLTSLRVGATNAGLFLIRPSNAAGVAVRSLDVGSTIVVVNESAGDIDFRAESIGNANMLFVNAGNSRVGVGTAVLGGILNIDQWSTTGSIPVIILDQADISEEFIKFIGAAAAGVLTQSIVDEGDQASEVREGWLKVEVEDVGDQIADQAYYLPIYSLVA